MKNNFLLILFISLLNFCCSLSNKNSIKNISFTIDSLKIRIDSSFLQSYYIFDYQDSSNIYIGYNAHNHSLDLISLKNKQTKKIILKKEGPNKIGEVQGIEYINNDSIFLYEFNYLKIINSKGDIRSKYNLHQLNKNQHCILSTNQYSRLQLNKKKKTIIFFNTYDKTPYRDLKIFSSFNLSDSSLTPLNIKFSNIDFKKNEELGYLAYANYELLNDSILVYNYLYHPDIYTYNINTNISKKIIQRPYLPPIEKLNYGNKTNAQKWEEHAIQNPHYFQVLKDSFRDLFYTFHWKPIVYQIDKNTFNSFIDKQLTVTVFNKHFKIIGEFELPTHTYLPFSWFVSPKGLVISNAHPLNTKNSDESHFTLHTICINL